MNEHHIANHHNTVKRIGIYAGALYLKKQGIPFEITYMIVFGRKPRLV